MLIQQSVTTANSGLFASTTLQADFLRASPSYIPDVDPRLPKHTVLTGYLVAGNSATITVSNVSIFPTPNVAARSYGAVRVGQEVILYQNKWQSNSSLTGLTRNIAGTAGNTISSNVAIGTIVSSLGLRAG